MKNIVNSEVKSKTWQRARLARHAEWKSEMSSEACQSHELRIMRFLHLCSHTLSNRQDKNSLQAWWWLSILESRISEISNSGSSSTVIGGLGFESDANWIQSCCSKMENMENGCTEWRLSGSHRVTNGFWDIQFHVVQGILREFIGRSSHGIIEPWCVLGYQSWITELKSMGLTGSLVWLLSFGNVLPELLV